MAESARFERDGELGIVVIDDPPLTSSAGADKADDELQEGALAFAKRLASGPTAANAATKRVVRAFLEDGVRGADARMGEIGAPLFGTEDLQQAVESFLEHGPGKATFEGR